MDNDTVKWSIGHTKDSRVMETTYSHLSDMDFREKAEHKAGLIDETDRNTLTPKRCSCGEKVAPTAKACPNCGMLFSPDARAAQEKVHDKMKESYKQTDPEDTGTQEKLDTLDNLLDDPEVKTALLEKLGDED